MKLKLLLPLLLAFLFSGCVHLPDPYKGLPSSPTANVSQASASLLNNADSLLPSEPVTVPATTHSTAKAIRPPSPARVAIQHAVNWITVICILGALAAVGFGAFLIYGGQILAGAKCVIGGVLLMIASIWFAYHWLLVVGLSLIGAGVYLAITYWTYISPILSTLESDISPAIKSVSSKVEGILHFKGAITPKENAAPPATTGLVSAPTTAPHITLG